MTIQRRLTTRLIGLLLILLLAGQAAPTPVFNVLAQSEGYVATLDPVLGLIQHQTAQDDPRELASWHTVTEPILVGEGDRIRTDGDGLAYLTFFEGVETEIRESTLVIVSTLALPDENDPAFNISLDVLVGTTFTSVETILGPDDRFEVHTPGATAAVRGTRWYTMVTPGGETAFATERGRIQIISNPPRAPAPPPAAAAPLPEEAAEPDAAMSAAAPNFLAEGSAVLTDRYGSVIERLDNVEFPERQDRASIQKDVAASDCGDGVCLLREYTACPVDCLDQINLPGCGDGTCDLDAGEDLLVCAADCGPWAGDTCGNGTCDAGENGVVCPADCGQQFSPVQPEQCGNGTCDPSESALNCPVDCHRETEG